MMLGIGGGFPGPPNAMLAARIATSTVIAKIAGVGLMYFMMCVHANALKITELLQLAVEMECRSSSYMK